MPFAYPEIKAQQGGGLTGLGLTEPVCGAKGSELTSVRFQRPRSFHWAGPLARLSLLRSCHPVQWKLGKQNLLKTKVERGGLETSPNLCVPGEDSG